ncbi:MAG: septum formation initiator family protein [Patescibacteria group bacterium]|nr:septum formation initiator family protein [Patescibacteria group bacterium]
MPQRTSFRYLIVIIIGCCLIAVVGYYYWFDYQHAQGVETELNALRQEAATLQTRNIQMADLLKYFDSAGYAETRARLELGLTKPGESVMVIPPDQAGSIGSPARAASSPVPEQQTPLRAWWTYFFSRRTDG